MSVGESAKISKVFDENPNEKLGVILKYWRKIKRLTAEELSVLTGGNVSARTIQRIEGGTNSATYNTFNTLRSALGLTTPQMYLPFFVEEERVPIYSARALPQSNYFEVNFTPGKTTLRYIIQPDAEQYAIVLQESVGLLGKGTVLHVSPNAEKSHGMLAIGFSDHGAVKLFRIGLDPESESFFSNAEARVHRVVLIVPA